MNRAIKSKAFINLKFGSFKGALSLNCSVVSENSKNYTKNFGLGFKFLGLLIQKLQSSQQK